MKTLYGLYNHNCKEKYSNNADGFIPFASLNENQKLKTFYFFVYEDDNETIKREIKIHCILELISEYIDLDRRKRKIFKLVELLSETEEGYSEYQYTRKIDFLTERWNENKSGDFVLEQSGIWNEELLYQSIC